MKIILSPHAEKQLRKISKVDQIIIAKRIRSIQKSTQVGKTEKLQGYKNVFRIRIGDYRIVYKKTKSLFYIILIGHRKEIYKLVSRLLK